MTPEFLHEQIILPGLGLIAPRYNSPKARAMLIAIALQESGLTYRQQMNCGPARGWWQFEWIGVRGARLHHRTGPECRAVCSTMGYKDADSTHLAIKDNDLLAVAVARLCLFSYPGPLPGEDEVVEGWVQYLERWRPGRPRREKWERNYRVAWEVVNAMQADPLLSQG